MGRCPCDGGAVALLPQQASQAGLPCVQPALRNLPGVLNPIPWGLLTGTAPGGRALAVPPAPAAPVSPAPVFSPAALSPWIQVWLSPSWSSSFPKPALVIQEADLGFPLSHVPQLQASLAQPQIQS